MLQAVIEQIKQAREPLTIYLDDGTIDDADIQLIAEALKEAQAPLTLHLSHINLGASEVRVRSIAEAIKEAQVPIVLYLANNNLGDSGAALMAYAIENARFPLFLDLSSNAIGSAGAELIAGAAMRAKVSLILDLGNNNLGDDGIRSIADAIRQAKVRLVLYLHNNGVRDDGAKFIAAAIEEAAPSLFLDLGLNMIGDEGAQFLADALVKVQFSVTLDLYWNNIGIHGVKSLAYALKHAKAPINLNVNYCVESDVARVMNEALADNFVVDSRSNPPRFLTRLGFNLCKKALELQLSCPFMASLIQEYIGASDLAWTEVTAIKKIEGASKENKYSSINSAVLDMAYFNAPPDDQQLPELVDATPAAGQPQELQPDDRLRLHFNSGRKRKKLTDYKKLADYKWVILKRCKLEEEDEEEYCSNLDSPRDDGSDSESSVSCSSAYGGNDDGVCLEVLSSQQSTEKNPLLSTTQFANYEQEQVLQEDGNNATEQWLMALFTWIKDLSTELQQHILSSFSLQRVLKLLEQTIHPHKVIDDQLSDKPVAEIFEMQYQGLYGSVDTEVNATDCARASQEHSTPISIEPSGKILGNLVTNPMSL